MCNVHCIMMEIIDSNVKVPSLGGGNDIPNSILCCDIAVMPLETFAKDFDEAGAQPVHSVVHEASARALYCKMDLKINLVNLYFDRACTISVLISVPNALSFLAGIDIGFLGVHSRYATAPRSILHHCVPLLHFFAFVSHGCIVVAHGADELAGGNLLVACCFGIVI